MPLLGQIHSAVESVAWPARDGPARRGLLVLQAHAGQCAAPDTAHGDVACQKEIKKQNN